MPRPLPYPTISEADLRRMLKTVAFNVAVRDLALGYPLDRRQFANGVVVTRWDLTPAAPTQVIFTEKGAPFLFECTCEDYAEMGKCQHTNGAALAWVRAPETFMVTSEDFALDPFFEILDGVLSPEDALDLLGAAGLAGAEGRAGLLSAAASGTATPITTTVLPQGELRAVVTARRPPLSPAGWHTVLDPLNLNQLRQVAQRRGVPITGVKRDAVLQALITAFSRPEALAELWPSLSPAARLVLAVLPFITTTLGVMAHQLQAVMAACHAEVLPRLEPAVKELMEAGLLSSTPYGYYYWPPDLITYFPPDPAVLPAYADERTLRVAAAPPALEFVTLTTRLLLALHSGAATLRARPAPTPHPLEAQLPNLARGWPYFPGELEAILRQKSPQQAVNRYAFSVPPAPPPLTDEARAALSAQLAAPPEVLDFALHLLVGRGLVRLTPGQAPHIDPAVFANALGEHPLAQVLPLFAAYVNNNSWTEFDLAAARRRGLLLAHPGNLHAGFTMQNLLRDMAANRTNLLTLLRRAPAGAWIDVAGVLAHTHALNLSGAFWASTSPFGAYLEGQPLDAARLKDWRAFYGGFLEAILTGPLHWQGVVDLGYVKDQLVAFRFTELGAYVLYQQLELAAPPVAADGPRLTFLPDGGLRLQPLGAGPELVGLLGLLGQVQVGPAGQLDYTLTAASVSAAFQAGWESERLLAELAEAAGRPVPAALAARLREWEARFGEVQIYTSLALVELADDYALTELLAGTSLARLLLYRFSPRLIAVRPEGLAEWRAELVAKGYTPRTET